MKHNAIKSLAAIIVAACLPTAASAQNFMSGGIGYHILSAEDHTVEVTTSESCTPYRGNINIPATVTYGGTTYDVVALGDEAFSSAFITSITIPTSVTRIGYGCFIFALLPSAITIPASVTEVEPLAFAANGLTTINVDTNNPAYRGINGMLFSKDSTTLVACPKTRSGTVVLPQETRFIASLAFAYCQNLASVTLPEGLRGIGGGAFVSNLSLNNVVIPASVTLIEGNPFPNCPALSNLSIAEGNTRYYMDGTMIYSAGGDTLVSAHMSADSVYLPNTLRHLSGFGGNRNVRFVQVPNGVISIGNEAFNGSTLASIDLPGSMSRIDGWAFSSCASLTRVGMPTTLDSMGTGCFYSCSGLAAISIPDGLPTIPKQAFFMCTSLADVSWGNAVELIDTGAFSNCPLTELTLPPTLRVIRQAAFIGDYRGRLGKVSFTAPIDTIEMDAFYNQPLRLLRLQNTVPPVTTDDGCLDGIQVDTIYIPCGTMATYLADDYWGQFANAYHEDCNGIEDTHHEKVTVLSQGNLIAIHGAQGEPVYVFDALGRQVYHAACASDRETASMPSSGVYVVKVGNNTAMKVVSVH